MFNSILNRFGLFLTRKKPPQATWIYINGDIYMRQLTDIVVLYHKGPRIFRICKPDHVASNGVAVQQIAYAIAIVDNLISVDYVMPTESMPPMYRGPGVN